jgi:hypothetical protein
MLALAMMVDDVPVFHHDTRCLLRLFFLRWQDFDPRPATSARSHSRWPVVFETLCHFF